MSSRIQRSVCGVAILCAAVFIGACGSKPSPETSSGAAAAPAVEKAAASAPASAAASIATSGKVTTVTGSGEQASGAIKFEPGAYLFNWTGTGAFVSITLVDGKDDAIAGIALGGPNGQDLLSVDQEKAGDVRVQVSSDASWTVKIQKADASSPAPLPQVMTGEEMKAGISQPFKLAAGTLNVEYKYKGEPKGTGTLVVCEANTGKCLTGGFMYAGRDSGSFEVKVPTAGVYIARTGFPLASGGGEVKLSQ